MHGMPRSLVVFDVASCFAGLDFDRIIYCNIGNPQQLQQKPITFFRQASDQLQLHNYQSHITISTCNTSTPPTQVLALVDFPQLIDHPSSPAIFPPDAIARARDILASEPGGTGCALAARVTASIHSACCL
jgi:alanine transaminase